jgi:hypothetical protein
MVYPEYRLPAFFGFPASRPAGLPAFLAFRPAGLPTFFHRHLLFFDGFVKR